jgi:predicted porin
MPFPTHPLRQAPPRRRSNACTARRGDSHSRSPVPAPWRLCLIAGMGLASAAAQAQSNATVFGIVDAGVQKLSASGAASLTSVISDGNASSRWGFRGLEDLGGGQKAGFWLEGGFSPDTGVSGSTSSNNKDSVAGALFGRRSTVSLMGGWGEVRAGRDTVPSFHNLSNLHPFGTNGVGSAGFLFYPVNAGGTTVRTNVRASNAVSYFLPADLGGFSGQLMYALGEQPSTPAATKSDGRYAGIHLRYAQGPLMVGAATGETRFATGDFRQSNAGASYRFGPARLIALWGENKVGATRTRSAMLGTQIDVGDGQVRFGYTQLEARGVANDAEHIALGYLHNLSKRTALYANLARVDNDGTGRSFGVGLAPVTPGGASKGLEVGLRHTF